MKLGRSIVRNFIDIPDAVAEFPIRALQLGIPTEQNIDAVERFIEQYAVPAGITHITLSLYYGFEYPSHPEIVDRPAASAAVARRLAEVCHRNNMEIVPEMNIPAHQSTIYQGWKPFGLLRAYPDMEEVMDEELTTSTREVCVLHPRLRPIACDMIDDLMEAFDTKIIHTGFDEVFQIGKCPRCRNTPKHILFADLVNDMNRHIRSRGGTMWMWGDRLLDGQLIPNISSEYESSEISTWRAADLISKDIMICDWHYNAEPYGHLTPSFWVMKGNPYLSCPFNSIHGTEQLIYATRVLRDAPNTHGIYLTTWCDMDAFIRSVDEKYQDYRATGILRSDPSLETSNIENAHNFAEYSSNIFLKMFVRPTPKT